MSKSCKNITKQILVASIVVSLGFAPASASESVQLRGSVNDSAAAIPLKNGIKIDKSNRNITLNLRDSDVKQVLRMLADKAGLNIVFHDSVSGKITLDLVNVTLNKAFEYIMTLNGLTYWQDGGSLIVAAKSAALGLGITTNQIKPIKIKYVDASMVADFLNTNIFSLNKPDISNAGIVVSNSGSNEIIVFGNDNDIALAQKLVSYLDVKPSVTTFNVNHSDLTELGNKICNIVFSSSSSSTTGSTTAATTTSTSSGSSSSGSTSVPVGSTVSCSGLASVGTSSQATVGASSASSSGSSSSGSFSGNSFSLKSFSGAPSFRVSGDPQLGQITLFGGTQEQIKLAEEVVKKFDKKPPQAYIEISIIELSESGIKSLGGQFMTGGGSASFAFRGTSAKGELASRNLVNMPGYQGPENILSNFTTYPSIDVFVSSLEALIEKRKGKVLANPRIIATHGQTSTIDISSDYVKTKKTENVASGDSNVNTITYEIGDAGIQLDLTPKISPNGYVTIDLRPSYTTTKETVTGVNAKDIIATLLSKRDLDLKGVRIKDGETLVLGGLIQENENKTSYKVPILGDLPIIGAMFKNNSTNKSKSELIIMVTPKIIKDENTVENI